MMKNQRPLGAFDVPTPSGLQGNLKTVAVMRKLARQRASHPKIRDLAKSIVLSYMVPSMHYYDEALVIGAFVQENVRYIRDANNIEQLHDPLVMIKHIEKGTAQGDCDDMALLIATLLLSIGHQPYFRTVRYRSKSGPYNHIYVVVYESNNHGRPKRLSLDAIVKAKPIGFEVPHVSGDEYPA